MKATASLVALLVATAASRVNAQADAPAPPPCDPADTHWVCGQQTPEDLVALPGGAWVISSAYQGTGGMRSFLRLSLRAADAFARAEQ